MSYTITTPPPTLLPPTSAAMISFLENFYRISDTESLHNEYVTNFTEDATLIMGSKVAKGLDEILTLRHGLWTHVARRKHTPERVYFGAERELMLYGTVKYVLRKDVEAGKPDEEIEVPWAGRVVFDEKVEKMRFYQVYLDPTAQGGKK
ncbi:uncharacterized protein AKAW2_31180S [Aspergillus luchuensis]|uniref:Fungal specific transcription factor n=3 Tax=Aspergillus subgen. Circumdati TaxID=2720871 RepID=A0A146F5Z0_ASPKA|nr:hypothetical protein BO85DRAFT_89687 [Aspergillus piperis CBS 112811]XP_041541627.1 uncharacterized protein AKAW2_31180S [Aspergillus luchuensis]GAA83422.1 hypothetical protein AKAW_01537 [Aspergillus luchuensis IFO 4308]RAH55002.1 hypothetical protein BO85DRAFT_89687 [Aspergillus piperis CBS 112811]BCR97861.1 hypothetical protein AKAW2_31180S [Aspergillus luchuensis]GAT21517.1 hypothetical protein RIB2604_01004070 [Aspergillus luchuensis]